MEKATKKAGLKSGAKKKVKQVAFNAIEHNGNKLELKTPLATEMQSYNGGFILTCNDFDIVVVGETERECKANFQEEFLALMDMFSVPDEELRAGEMLRKRELTALLKQ